MPVPWPVREALLLKVVAHHLWYPARRESDARHGMAAEVATSSAKMGSCGRTVRMRAGPSAAGSRPRQPCKVDQPSPLPADPADPRLAPLPCLALRLGGTKTTSADEAHAR